MHASGHAWKHIGNLPGMMATNFDLDMHVCMRDALVFSYTSDGVYLVGAHTKEVGRCRQEVWARDSWRDCKYGSEGIMHCYQGKAGRGGGDCADGKE